MHWHLVGDATGKKEGYIRDSSVHESYYRLGAVRTLKPKPLNRAYKNRFLTCRDF